MDQSTNVSHHRKVKCQILVYISHFYSTLDTQLDSYLIIIANMSIADVLANIGLM